MAEEHTELTDMISNIVFDKNEDAQVDFHKYLGGKIKTVLSEPVSDNNHVDGTNV